MTWPTGTFVSNCTHCGHVDAIATLKEGCFCCGTKWKRSSGRVDRNEAGLERKRLERPRNADNSGECRLNLERASV